LLDRGDISCTFYQNHTGRVRFVQSSFRPFNPQYRAAAVLFPPSKAHTSKSALEGECHSPGAFVMCSRQSRSWNSSGHRRLPVLKAHGPPTGAARSLLRSWAGGTCLRNLLALVPSYYCPESGPPHRKTIATVRKSIRICTASWDEARGVNRLGF